MLKIALGPLSVNYRRVLKLAPFVLLNGGHEPALAMENARWGKIKGRLPQPHQVEFEEFINTLHIKYSTTVIIRRKWKKNLRDGIEELVNL